MPLRNSTTSQRVRRWALRVLIVSGPLTLAALAAWLIDPDLLGERPAYDVNPMFALYQLLLLISLSAGIVAAVTSGQIGTARAFTAGYNTGLAVSRASQETDGDGGGHSWPQPMPLRLLK